ncbi:hypothetical protein Scep_023801 [Stephania cephalantha]|uniref:Aminotransferase-like plant mobile domain-containing protein n=1 Tax=Stephania cephalantha TaxID=152367 RepID=A0AAP0EVC7_9MAGN
MHVLTKYREMIDMQTLDEVIWEPYPETVIRDMPAYCSSGRAIWRTRAPLLFFCVVEMYNPDRVMRQFGLKQRIPPLHSTNMELHNIDLRGKTIKIGVQNIVFMSTCGTNVLPILRMMNYWTSHWNFTTRICYGIVALHDDSCLIVELLLRHWHMTSIHQLTLGDDVSILRIIDVAASTLTAIHADYHIHNMPTSFEASHQSSHDDTCSRHDTSVYTPSIPLNQFQTLYTPSVPLNELETPHTPSVPPNMAFEATEAFQFDRTPTSSRHFNASPIMMNLSGTTSTHDGGMHDIDDIQREDAQNPADVGHSNVPLALNRNVRVVKRTRCGPKSLFGVRLGLFLNYNKTFFLFILLLCS